MTFDFIETERLSLRPFTIDILDALIAADRELLQALSGARFPDPLTPPPLMEDALPFIRDRMRQEPDGWPSWFAVERATGLAVCAGGAGFAPDDRGVATLGYSCYPAFEGRGFATELARALIEWAIAQPGVAAVEATIPPWNRASIRVAEKLGMSRAGTVRDDEAGEVFVYRLERAAR